MRSQGLTGTILVPPAKLRQWAASKLEACGVPRTDAKRIAASLVQSSLWGIDSHGIARLPHYLRRLRAGSIESRPVMRFTATGPCTGTLEGGHGLGILVCHRAMEEAIRMARENGVGVVGCRHSTHCGAIGLYGRQAAREGLVGIAFTHSDAFVTPHHGRKAFLGTNPICIAVPAAGGPPVCVDMATSATTMNRMMNARREGQPIVDGVALDQRGQLTTDPDAVSALLPMAAHKGYALAFLIDVLCGPLNGMPFGPHIPAMYGDQKTMEARRNLGSLLVALDPKRFAGGTAMARTVAAMADEARRQPVAAAGKEVLVPGDPEYRTERVRAVEGIPVEPGLRKELGLRLGTRGRAVSAKAIVPPAKDAKIRLENQPLNVKRTKTPGTAPLPCKTPYCSA